jgi:hypothetical protein
MGLPLQENDEHVGAHLCVRPQRIHVPAAPARGCQFFPRLSVEIIFHIIPSSVHP